jgi:6-phosphogluconolactonase
VAQVQVSPSWFRWHPTLPVLYSTNETMFGEESSVTAYRITPSAGLELMGRVTTKGGSCCHLSVSPDGCWIGATNHAPDPDVENVPEENKCGSVALISLDPATGDVVELAHHIVHAPPTDPAVLSHPNRDDHTPHAHSANWSPSGSYLFVCEKGLDLVLIYKLDPAAGALTLHSQAAVTFGGSARHLTVHPNGRWVYVNEEKGGRVNLFDWDDEAGTLSLRQQVSTLPADWTSGGTYANVQPIQTCWHMSFLRNDLI